MSETDMKNFQMGSTEEQPIDVKERKKFPQTTTNSNKKRRGGHQRQKSRMMDDTPLQRKDNFQEEDDHEDDQDYEEDNHKQQKDVPPPPPPPPGMKHGKNKRAGSRGKKSKEESSGVTRGPKGHDEDVKTLEYDEQDFEEDEGFEGADNVMGMSHVLKQHQHEEMKEFIQDMYVWPDDKFNNKLISKTHPFGYVNPNPKLKYDLVIIGAGMAGRTAAEAAASHGAHIALIENTMIGGNYLRKGCVPSKALLKVARTIREAKKAHNDLNIFDGKMSCNFGKIMEMLREKRANLASHNDVNALNEKGIDVFYGSASFKSTQVITVEDQFTLNFRRALIATGSKQNCLATGSNEIKGLRQAGYTTNKTIFNLTEAPKTLAIIGAGRSGVEMAQAFSSFGVKVHLFERANRLLPKEDACASQMLMKEFREVDGIHIHLNSRITEVRSDQSVEHDAPVGEYGETWSMARKKTILYARNEDEPQNKCECDLIFVCVGRIPNVGSLNLELAKIDYNDVAGLSINDHFRTTNKRVYGAGDCAWRQKFTNTAHWSGQFVVENALFKGKFCRHELNVPTVIYTQPQIAHVGVHSADIDDDRKITTLRRYTQYDDRSVIDGDSEGYVEIIVDSHGLILGSTIVSDHAADLIAKITILMNHKISLQNFSQNIVFPYPIHSNLIRVLAEEYREKFHPIRDPRAYSRRLRHLR